MMLRDDRDSTEKFDTEAAFNWACRKYVRQLHEPAMTKEEYTHEGSSAFWRFRLVFETWCRRTKPIVQFPEEPGWPLRPPEPLSLEWLGPSDRGCNHHWPSFENPALLIKKPGIYAMYRTKQRLWTVADAECTRSADRWEDAYRHLLTALVPWLVLPLRFCRSRRRSRRVITV